MCFGGGVGFFGLCCCPLNREEGSEKNLTILNGSMGRGSRLFGVRSKRGSCTEWRSP